MNRREMQILGLWDKFALDEKTLFSRYIPGKNNSEITNTWYEMVEKLCRELDELEFFCAEENDTKALSLIERYKHAIAEVYPYWGIK